MGFQPELLLLVVMPSITPNVGRPDDTQQGRFEHMKYRKNIIKRKTEQEEESNDLIDTRKSKEKS